MLGSPTIAKCRDDVVFVALGSGMQVGVGYNYNKKTEKSILKFNPGIIKDARFIVMKEYYENALKKANKS